MKSNPLVCVYIPVYNGEKYLALTLGSLLCQTYQNIEFIIVNDGSTDTSLEIATNFAQKDSRIKILSHSKNLGLSAARNTGWQSAHESAKYLLNHDCDDISYPQKIEHQVRFLENNPNVSAVGCFCRYINELNVDIGFPLLEWKPERIRKTFGIFNSMVVSATLVRREVFSVLGKFRAEYGGCDDYDFWNRMLLHGFTLRNIPEFLHDIRIHSVSFSNVHAAAMDKQAQTIREHYKANCTNCAYNRIYEKLMHKVLKIRMLRAVTNK